MRLVASKLGPILFLVIASQAVQGQQTSPPRPLYSPDPEYSEQARIQQLEGTCLLRATVGSDGAVYDVEVEHRLEGGQDEKSVEALRRWRFEPARKDGRPVAAEVHVEMTFRIHFTAEEQEEFQAKLRASPEVPSSTTIEPCPVRIHDAVPLDSRVALAELTFDGSLQLPLEDQNQIAASIKERVFTGSPEFVTDGVLELVREGWQDRGYFQSPGQWRTEATDHRPDN